MKKYLSRPENHLCADCKRPSPTWASLNIGVFVCIKCSGCHREIGVHITKIKSVELDLWPSKSLTDFAKINNEIANAYWEYDLRNFDFQKIRDNEIRLIDFIRDKYEFKRWAKPNVPDPMSLVIQGRDLVKEYMNNGDIVKLYEKSEEPELEKRSKHFNVNKNEKKGRSFGILDKKENINNNNINNINNQNYQNMNQVKENNQNEKKGFSFIKKKQNQKENNNEINNNINNTNNTVVDLLGFGNDDLNEQTNQNTNTINNNMTNDTTNNNSGINNIFPLDIFSFGQQNNDNNNNINNSNNINNIVNNDNNNEKNEHKSGFSFIKNKKKHETNNNNITNNNNDINSLFENNNNPTVNNNNNNMTNIENVNQNNLSNLNNINKTSIPNVNIQKQNSNGTNNIINLFESDQLVDLFNIETPTSDAVLNLSKNLINIYSNENEEENNNNQNNNIINNKNPIPNTNSNYNVLNMNYPNININNYYPNNEQQKKNKPMMNNNNYGMNPMMGYNYPNQGYMNNNFGFWYGYNMNMNPNYMNMGMGMNTPINTGFNYQNEFFNEKKIEKEKEKEEQKPILLNNNLFELNFARDLKKEKDDPFKNLVDFK